MNAAKYVVLTLAVCSASALLTVELFGQSRAASPVPLTLEATDTTFGPDGEVILEERTFVAYRSDGSTVRVTQHRGTDGTLQELRNIVDLDAGRKIVVSSKMQSTTTYPFTQDEVAAMRSSRAVCPRDAVEADPIMGFEAVVSTRDLADPLGEAFRNVTYYAPGLGCIPIRGVLTKLEADGSERLVKRSELVQIDLGDPGPALFRVPVDYTEMSPAEYLSSSGTPAGDRDENSLAGTLESNYRVRNPSSTR